MAQSDPDEASHGQGPKAPEHRSTPPQRGITSSSPEESPEEIPAEGAISVEKLFSEAGRTYIDYILWNTHDKRDVRNARLCDLMSQQWTVAEIKEAISEVALACFWLSGRYSTYWSEYEPHPESARIHNLWMNYDPAKAEQLWEEYQRAAEIEQSKSHEQQWPESITSTEATRGMDPTSKAAFDKALRRASKAFRQNGCSTPEPLGGAGDGWILVEIGRGGHGGAHRLIKRQGQQSKVQKPSPTDWG